MDIQIPIYPLSLWERARVRAIKPSNQRCWNTSMLTLPELNFEPHSQNQEAFEYTADPKLETESSIVLTCGLWRHSLEPKDFTVRMVPTTLDSPITGHITCTVHADNLRKPAPFKLVVTLSPDYRPTLEPALQWFTTPHPD